MIRFKIELSVFANVCPLARSCLDAHPTLISLSHSLALSIEVGQRWEVTCIVVTKRQLLLSVIRAITTIVSASTLALFLLIFRSCFLSESIVHKAAKRTFLELLVPNDKSFHFVDLQEFEIAIHECTENLWIDPTLLSSRVYPLLK